MKVARSGICLIRGGRVPCGKVPCGGMFRDVTGMFTVLRAPTGGAEGGEGPTGGAEGGEGPTGGAEGGEGYRLQMGQSSILPNEECDGQTPTCLLK